MPKKEYIGDSVYASFDGNAITLTTENGLATDPSNKIVIDGYTMKALLEFMNRLGVIKI